MRVGVQRAHCFIIAELLKSECYFLGGFTFSARFGEFRSPEFSNLSPKQSEF